MALHVLNISGTRSFYLTDNDAPDRVFSADRSGLGMPEGFYLPGQHLQGFEPVHADSQPVDSAGDLRALVGLWATSRDERRGLRLVRRTTNRDQRFFAALRFDLPTWGSIAADAIESAELHYRVRPWVFGGDTWTNSADGCVSNKVAEARRLTQPLSRVAPMRRGDDHAWPVAPSSGHPLAPGISGVDIADIAREWHRDTRLGFSDLAGNLLLYPARPDLDAAGRIEGVPLFPNRRRRTHWVRQRRWKLGEGHYEYRCASLLGNFHILMKTRD